jgi:hypothetical protein
MVGGTSRAEQGVFGADPKARALPIAVSSDGSGDGFDEKRSWIATGAVRGRASTPRCFGHHERDRASGGSAPRRFARLVNESTSVIDAQDDLTQGSTSLQQIMGFCCLGEGEYLGDVDLELPGIDEISALPQDFTLMRLGVRYVNEQWREHKLESDTEVALPRNRPVDIIPWLE